MARTTIDLCLRAIHPMDDPLEFNPDPQTVALARESLAKRRYQQMMEDAQFGPGAIIDAEA